MITTPDGVNIYTDQDVQEKVAEAKTIATDSANKYTNLRIAGVVETTFKSEVREGNMEEDYAVGLYNNLASQLDWSTIDNLSVKYTATVYAFDDELFTINDIEADDEQSAEQSIWDDLNISNVRLSFDVEANGEGGYFKGDVYDLDDFINDNIKIEVTEQD
jgi:hypothetical protein